MKIKAFSGEVHVEDNAVDKCDYTVIDILQGIIKQACIRKIGSLSVKKQSQFGVEDKINLECDYDQMSSLQGDQGNRELKYLRDQHHLH